MEKSSLNEKQKDHCAAVLNAVALAQFGAIGFVAYTGSNYFQAFYSAVAFVEMELLALLILSNFPPPKWLFLAPALTAIIIAATAKFKIYNLTPLDQFAIILYIAVTVLLFVFVVMAQWGNQPTDRPSDNGSKIVAGS